MKGFAGAPVEWGAATDGLVLGAAVFASPVPHADRPVAEVLEGHAQRVLSVCESRQEQGTTSIRVREVLRASLREGAPGEDAVARKLGTSRRTLQRRLQEAGTAFAALIEEVRRDAAKQLLADPQLSVAEASAQFGVSEPSAFQRAFRRWNGVSPGEWRKARQLAVTNG